MEIITDYQALHAIPELDRKTFLTVRYLRNSLSMLRCQLCTPIPGSLCAFFDFGMSETLAFRADIDALPIRETTGLPWSSRHPGAMHACGHDGHAAILLELARRIQGEKHLPHNILLIFQPAEETDGGARELCGSSILQTLNVRHIFGLHLWPGLPSGQLFSKPGALMCRSSGILCAFRGKSVHIAESRRGIDALGAAMAFCQAAERRSIPGECFVKFGKLSGGTAGNIVCGEASLWGSLRSFSGDRHPVHKQRLTALCNRICKKFGCQGSVTFSDGYPGVWNDPGLWQKMQKKCPVSVVNRTFLTADDFSFYQQQIPGLYYLLGVGDTPPLHSPNFQFDPRVLQSGAAFFHTVCRIQLNG